LSRKGDGDAGRAKGPGRNYVHALVAILVAILTLASAMFWTGSGPRPEGTRDSGPLTLEGWLYDYYYNATVMGYDRDEWGGKVIWTEDPAALVDPDPDNLTVPVFVYVPRELTAPYIDSLTAKFFPGVNSTSLRYYPSRYKDGVVTAVRVGDGRGTLEIQRDGNIEYRAEYLHVPIDVYRSNESAQEHATEWLEAHGLWPSDVGGVRITQAAHSYDETIAYVLTVARQDPFPGFDMSFGRIELAFEANMGTVFDVDIYWPELTVPFVVTDLPPVNITLELFGLKQRAENDSTFFVSDMLTYRVARVIRQMGLRDTALVYFYLPYRSIGYGQGYMNWTSGDYGVIFPEEAMYLIL